MGIIPNIVQKLLCISDNGLISYLGWEGVSLLYDRYDFITDALYFRRIANHSILLVVPILVVLILIIVVVGTIDRSFNSSRSSIMVILLLCFFVPPLPPPPTSEVNTIIISCLDVWFHHYP